MIAYLLIDGRRFIPYKEKFRIFTTKEACLTEARKLGYGKGIFGEMATLGDTPGVAIMEQGGDDMDVTLIPVEIEGSINVAQTAPGEVHTFQGDIKNDGSAEKPCTFCGASMGDHYGGICARLPEPTP